MNENFVSFENMQDILNGIAGKVSTDDAYVGKITWQMCLIKDHLKLDGTTLGNASTDYPELLAFAVDNQLVAEDDNSVLFHRDAADDTLTLPNFINLCLQGGESVSQMAAGLPNIRSILQYIVSLGGIPDSAINENAALTWSTRYTAALTACDMSSAANIVFDASKSNPIYGSSTTVQPPAVTLIPQIRYRLSAAPAACTVPVGTVIAFMGTQPPVDYMACDGAEYTIADQPVLAEFITRQFGTVNHFGGDGENTFAVPDLRGEFLRGTGVNSHANQGSGADVGAHQDGTSQLDILKFTDNKLYVGGLNMEHHAQDVDNIDYDSVHGRGIFSPSENQTNWKNGIYTSRPTNTSVLYCIKCR